MSVVCITLDGKKASVVTSAECARLNILPCECVDSSLCHNCVRAVRCICLSLVWHVLISAK